MRYFLINDDLHLSVLLTQQNLYPNKMRFFQNVSLLIEFLEQCLLRFFLEQYLLRF